MAAQILRWGAVTITTAQRPLRGVVTITSARRPLITFPSRPDWTPVLPTPMVYESVQHPGSYIRVYLHVDRSTGAHHRLSAHKHHRCAPDRTGSTQLLFTTNGYEHPARCAPVRSIMTIHLYVVGPCLPCF